jgi:hypothetical protein
MNPVPGAADDQAQAAEVDALIREMDGLLTVEAAAVKLVSHGAAAIEPLRRYLLDGRPSAVFQPRRWAVRALSGLGARDVLLEYVRRANDPIDPETRLGEDVVVGEAALLLSNFEGPEIADALLEVARRRAIPDLLKALVRICPARVLPILARALGDDFARPTAEELLGQQGSAARADLVEAATLVEPTRQEESETSRRRRSSALRLLGPIGLDADGWARLQSGLRDRDPEIRIRTAALGVAFGPPAAVQASGRVLLAAISASPWYLHEDIVDALTRFFRARPLDLERELLQEPEHAATPRGRVLRRVRERLHTAG